MNKNFFAIDNNIFNLKLDSYEFQIYCYLVSCAGKDNVCWPSYNTIAKLLQVNSPLLQALGICNNKMNDNKNKKPVADTISSW